MNEYLEFKAQLSVDEKGQVEGIAWPFGSADRIGDVIEKGAFAETAAALPMLWSHNPENAIGVWDSIKKTDTGLQVKGRLLVADVAKAKEVHALIREKAVSGLSIGFVTKKAAPRKGGGRTITALDLVEISVVAIPAHPGARITSSKAAGSAEGNSMEDNEQIEDKGEALEQKALDDLEAKIGARLDKLEAKMNRPAVITDKKQSDDIARKGFMAYARKGIERMSADEQKTLTVAVDAAGGYLAPEAFASELVKLLREYSPIRQYARVVEVGASEVKFPRRTTSTAATWVTETAARSSSEPAFEQLSFSPIELATYVDVSTALLEDNTYNLEAELAADLAESFAIAEGSAFVNGNGTTQPKGLLLAGQISNEVKTGVAADFPASNPADKIIDMFHAIPNAHAQNGVWLMNRTILATVRKWKDGQGRYLVVDPLTAGAPLSLLGRPIVEAVDMPNVGASNNVIVFGDLSGYRIVDRVSMSMLRDPYSIATTGQVRFHARKRVTAGVTHPDRLVRLKCST